MLKSAQARKSVARNMSQSEPLSPSRAPGSAKRISFASGHAAMGGAASPYALKKRVERFRARTWGDWFWSFQHSPTQPSAMMSPATFVMRFVWVLMVFATVQQTIPIDDVSVSTRGVTNFVNTATYTSLGGHAETLANVDTLDDMVAYQRALVAALFPREEYNEEPRDLQLYLLRVDRLMNSIVLSQRRVKPTHCAYANVRDLYPTCYEQLRPDTEVTEGYDGYKYDALVGGFHEALPLNRTRALREFDAMAEDKFWDPATRESSVRFAFMNAPGHFSGYCTVTFSVSAFGSVEHNVDVNFLRLQPYSEEVNGGRLVLLQVLCLACMAGMLTDIVLSVTNQPHVRYKIAYMTRPWALMDYAIIVLVCLGISSWVTFLSGKERDGFDPVDPQFHRIASLAVEFKTVMFYFSTVLLFSVLRTVEYMVLIDELAATYVALTNALVDIGWFMMLFVVLVGGFVLTGHVLFGMSVPMFHNLKSTGQNMMLWLLSLGGGHEALFDAPGGLLFLAVFLFVGVVLLFNIIMAMVFVAFEKLEEDMDATLRLTKKDRPYNHIAADWLCDANGVRTFEKDVYRAVEESGDTDDDSDAPLLADPPVSGRLDPSRLERGQGAPAD